MAQKPLKTITLPNGNTYIGQSLIDETDDAALYRMQLSVVRTANGDLAPKLTLTPVGE